VVSHDGTFPLIPGDYMVALRSTKTAATLMNVNRFILEMAALSPIHQLSPLTVSGIAPYFQNGYIGTWTAGFEQKLAGITVDAAYVGTAGIKLPVMDDPNAYLGATAAYTPYTQYNSSGLAAGGYGLMTVMTNRSHLTYHALQMSAQRDLTATGLGFQASYTLSKSIDDTSAVVGGFISGSSGAVVQTIAEDPNNFRLDKAVSNFDVKNVVSFSLFQDLHADRLLRPLPKVITGGLAAFGDRHTYRRPPVHCLFWRPANRCRLHGVRPP
jgi:hypothetical protein